MIQIQGVAYYVGPGGWRIEPEARGDPVSWGLGRAPADHDQRARPRGRVLTIELAELPREEALSLVGLLEGGPVSVGGPILGEELQLVADQIQEVESTDREWLTLTLTFPIGRAP